MASALEIFDATVFEAVHEVLSVPDGDAAIGNILAGLADVVEGLTYREVAEFLVPAIPRLVREEPKNHGTYGADPELIVNDFWYRSETFAPVFYSLARDYYERIRPASFPSAPVAEIVESDKALFGCDLIDMEFAGDEHSKALLLWAGCVAASVNLHFQQPVTLLISYPLLFQFVRKGAAA